MKRDIYFSKPLMNASILPPPVCGGNTVWSLACLAGIAVLNEEPERAAWLWGAAEALRQSIGAREAPASHANP